MSKMVNCKSCDAEIAKSAKVCPKCGAKNKKPIYKRVWFWAVIILIVIPVLVSSLGGDGDDADSQQASSQVEQNKANEVKKEEPKEEKREEIPKEYQSALKKADAYANDMYMSKAGLYDQLVSEHGENFSKEAAQYAIDNVEADWKENALKKATLYQDDMAMSPSAIYDQLISEHGEQFTKEEAQYAIDNLEK